MVRSDLESFCSRIFIDGARSFKEEYVFGDSDGIYNFVWRKGCV